MRIRKDLEGVPHVRIRKDLEGVPHVRIRKDLEGVPHVRTEHGPESGWCLDLTWFPGATV